jgi:hypothetical protein
VSEYDPIDAMIERAAREEQEKMDREHGQHILDMVAARRNAPDPLIEDLERAQRAKAQRAKAQADQQ